MAIVMEVTATELKQNLGKYLGMVSDAPIYVTKNGKRIAKLDNLKGERRESLRKLLDDKPPSNQEIWSVAAAAEYFGIEENEVSNEQLAEYYRMVEDKTRFEHRLEKDFGMTIKEWEKATGKKYVYTD